MEVLWVIDGHHLGVLNDDDFRNLVDEKKRRKLGKNIFDNHFTIDFQNRLYIINAGPDGQFSNFRLRFIKLSK